MADTHDKPLLLFGPLEFRLDLLAGSLMQEVVARQQFLKKPYFVVFDDAAQALQYASLLRSGCGMVIRHCAPNDDQFVKILGIDYVKGGFIDDASFPPLVSCIYCSENVDAWKDKMALLASCEQTQAAFGKLCFQPVEQQCLNEEGLRKVCSLGEETFPRMYMIPKEHKMLDTGGDAQKSGGKVLFRHAGLPDNMFHCGSLRPDFGGIFLDNHSAQARALGNDGRNIEVVLSAKRESKLSSTALDILNQAALEAGIDLLNFAHKVARKWGRGAFHIRFASSDALKACQAEDIQETLGRLCTSMFGKVAFDSLPKKVKESTIKSVTVPAGSIGNRVVYSPIGFLKKQFEGRDKETRLLRQYNPSTTYLVCSEQALEGGASDDIFSSLGAVMPDMAKIRTCGQHCTLNMPARVARPNTIIQESPKTETDTQSTLIDKEVEDANKLARKEKEERREHTDVALPAEQAEEENAEGVEIQAQQVAKPVSRRAEKRRAKRQQRAKMLQNKVDERQRKADEEFIRETRTARHKDVAHPLAEMLGPPVKPARIRKPKEMSSNSLAQDLQLGLWAAKLG